jgi:hypothetical protein
MNELPKLPPGMLAEAKTVTDLLHAKHGWAMYSDRLRAFVWAGVADRFPNGAVVPGRKTEQQYEAHLHGRLAILAAHYGVAVDVRPEAKTTATGVKITFRWLIKKDAAPVADAGACRICGAATLDGVCYICHAR